jgi:hypothetical protein
MLVPEPSSVIGTGLLQSPYGAVPAALLVREAVSLVVHLVRSRMAAKREAREQEIEATTAARELEQKDEESAYARLERFVAVLQEDLKTIKQENAAERLGMKAELSAERQARHAAEDEVRALREDVSKLRRSLVENGMVGLDCIKGARCALAKLAEHVESAGS